MLKLIIVPVDGSPFGEQALSTAVRVAELHGATLELVHVHVTLPPWRTQNAPVLDPAFDFRVRKDREEYLDGVATKLRTKTHAPVIATTLTSESVSRMLGEHIAERGADLVVMATHGTGGLSPTWLGSVANDLVRRSTAPVLLVRPDQSDSHAFRGAIQRVLVPLDGLPEAELVIRYALDVAGPGTTLVLLQVVVPVAFLGPDAAAFSVADGAELEERAASHLETVADQVRARGFGAEIRVVRHAQPARAILDTAADVRADLIAMATHGRKGIERLVLGSVADKVIRGSPLPVLLYRPTESATVA